MTPDIQEQVARNRRSVKIIDSNFIEVPTNLQRGLTFGRNTIRVTVEAEIYTRPLDDGLISGHPNGDVHGSGSGVSGDQRGAWSLVADSATSTTLTRGGRNAVRDALAGQTEGISGAVAGTGSGDASPSDTSLAAETGSTTAFGLKDAADRTTGVGIFGFAQTSPDPDADPTEFGLEGVSDQLLARVTMSAVSKTAEEELKAELTLDFDDDAGGEAVITTTGLEALADAIQLPGDAVTLNEIGWGTGTTAPQAGDTTLETEVLRKVADRTLLPEAVTAERVMEEGEPATQPHDLTEAAVFDNTGRMFYRVTYDPFPKDSDTRFRTTIGFRIV